MSAMPVVPKGPKPEVVVLAKAAIDVLRNHHTRRIRFAFKSMYGYDVKVDWTTFDRVAQAVENSIASPPRPGPQVRVKIGRNMGGLYGSYHEDGNKYTLQTNYSSRDWQATVVHEAVHASLDLTRSTVTAVDNETAAFIASAVYLAMTGMPIKRMKDLYEKDLKEAAHQAMTTGRVSDSLILKFRNLLVRENYNNGELFDTNPRGQRSWHVDVGNG